MKCKFLNPLKVSNPAWSEKDRSDARDAGRKYDVPERVEVDAGYEVEDPQAWIHCCPGDLNSAPIAEPSDDECRDAVRVWMEEKRPAAIKAIAAQLEQIDQLKNPEDRARLLAMGQAYGLVGFAAASDSKKSKAETKRPGGETK